MKLNFECDTSYATATQTSLIQCTQDQYSLPKDMIGDADPLSISVALVLAVLTKTSVPIFWGIISGLLSIGGMYYVSKL